MKKLSEEEVLLRIQLDGRYLPGPNFNYVRSNIPISLLCEKHGPFEMTLSNLLYKDGRAKKGCYDCGVEYVTDLSRISEKEVLRRIEVDGRYTPAADFFFVDTKTPILLNCEVHGDFKINFNKLCDADGKSKNHGCYDCFLERLSIEKRIPPNENSLHYLYPKVAKLWSKNNPENSNQVYPNANYVRNFICPDCEGEFPARVAAVVESISKRGKMCPYCNGKKIHPNKSNSLEKLLPEISQYWHKDNDLNPDEVTIGSDYIAKWNCSNFGCIHSWESTVYDRVRRFPKGCGSCAEYGFNQSEQAYLYLFSVNSKDEEILFYKLGITNDNINQRYNSFRKSLYELPRFQDCIIKKEEHILFEKGYDALKIESLLKGIIEIRFFPSEKYSGSTESFIINPIEYAREHNLL